MTTQPEALRLADAMDAVNTNNADSLLVQMAARSAAAELRRLHEELAATERQVEILSDDLSRCGKMNSELLETLYEIAEAGIGSVAPGYAEIARAAIAKAEGEHT